MNTASKTHAELLTRCGMDLQTYQQRAHRLRRRAAHDTRPAAQGTTPAAPDSTNNYKEEVLIEEIWRSIKEALKLEINRPNYEDYVQDTHAISFDRKTGTLTVEAPSPLVANHLNKYFTRSVRWAIADTNPSIHGVRISTVDFIPRPHQPWDAAEDDHPSP